MTLDLNENQLNSDPPTKNPPTQNPPTENPPTEDLPTENLPSKQTTEESTNNPANEQEATEKFKKTKFCQKETKDQKEAKIRNSPRLFNEMVYFLSDEQKAWVTKAGFEPLLGFDLEMVPSKLANKVVHVFDHKSVSLRIEHWDIYITPEDVFDVFGLPRGGNKIEQTINEVTTKRSNEWLTQFPTKKITTAKVVEQVKAEKRVTEMFKINFLTVLSNVLIRTPTHSYIDKYFVNFEPLDKCVSYNWVDFLIEYLVTGKESWNGTGSGFFRGSQIFLTLS
ncbi:hypothetical protein POM88_012919 [Heracleum sosnowskyi]|uniref:Uncharacterized protein n=1 Tax=Heracleum sosnowskyi TaxID=360622 RepID=A0AAD8IYZ1_9APIA|nr:hypothetical protein POM88_012919 [Heracleum sosnowskyi]